MYFFELFVQCRLQRRILDPRFCQTSVDRDRRIVKRSGAAELTLYQGHIEILERAKPRHTTMLIEDNEQQLTVPRIHLTRQSADAAVGLAKRAGLANDASF